MILIKSGINTVFH